MPADTKYKLQKRIKELEEENRRLRRWRELGFRLFEWLVDSESPNPKWGLKQFKEYEVSFEND